MQTHCRYTLKPGQGFLPLLACLGTLLPACVRPANAQSQASLLNSGPAPHEHLSCQTQPAASWSGEMPRDPFQRLLYRLDHAPVDLDALEPGSRRGSQISQAGTTFATAMAPVLPILDRVAHSPTLSLIAHIPVVGKPCAVAQLCLGAGKELGTGFTNLVGLDRKHLEPLRQAIQKMTALRRSRSPEDLAATVSALDAAKSPLHAYELASVKQRKGLATLTTALKGLDKFMAARNATASKQPSSLSNTIQSLEKLNMALFIQNLAVHQLNEYVETCASDGHEALADR